MNILIVDDEALARARLRQLLADGAPQASVAEAAHASAALALLQDLHQRPFDLLLLDIHMPGMDGLALAEQIRALPTPPALIFVTAHAGHALHAFELDAVDYLTKPVRLARLQQALAKVARTGAAPAAPLPSDAPALLVQTQGRTERVPLSEVLYLRAELKYLTLRTRSREYVLDTSLAELEARHGAQLLRIHRNTLVARGALRALERGVHPQEGDCTLVRLHGLAEPLPVSRRQVAAVRQALEEMA